MDPASTPPYHRSSDRSRTKSSSRVARNETAEPLRISLDLIPSPTTIKSTTSPSALSLLRSPTNSLPLRDLLFLSTSPIKRSKTRFSDRLDMAAEDLPDPAGLRRRCKSRGSQMGTLASPRNSRRSRRRSELEIREDKDVGLVDEVGKQRKRRHSGRSKKEKLSLVPYLPASTSSPTPKAEEEENGGDLDCVGQLMTDLIMWKDVSKSTLWFGFGFLCFLSSCFTKGLNFSIFSATSHFAILFLGVSFLSNSLSQRSQIENRSYAKLKEDDILRLAKLILPALNFAISKTRDLFSGEPSMTLKVAPLLLVGAEYGHLVTVWRLCAIGFFASFSVPKLYSSYSDQINQRADCLKLRLLDTWSACTHKKIVVASAFITFWNLSTIKTRIFTAFILLVILRYSRQHVVQQEDDGEAQVAENEQQQALVVAEPKEKVPQQARVVAEKGC